MNLFRKVWNLLRADAPSLLLFGRLGATLLAFITAPIVARTIGAEGRGETAAAIALFNLVPIILGIGIPLEVRRLAALGHAGSAIRAARIAVLCSFPLAATAGWLTTITLFSAFEPGAQWTAFVGIALSPLMIMWTCDSSVMVATGRYRGVMALQLVQPLAYLLLVCLFAATHSLSVSTALIANIAGTTAALTTGAWLTRIPMLGERRSLAALLRGGVRYAGSAIAEAASSRLDQVIALPLVGAVQAGLYSVAVTIASIPLALGQALGAAFFPLIARSEGKNRLALKEEALRSAMAMSVLTAPLLFAGSWLGIPLLFGREFSASVPVAWIAGIGTCALIVGYVCSLVLAAERRGYTMTIAQVSALAASTGLLFALAPEYGAMGAAAASSIGYILLAAIMLLASKARLLQSWPRPRDFKNAITRLMRA